MLIRINGLIRAFDFIENIRSLYRGEEINVITFERKKMLPLTQNELNLH